MQQQITSENKFSKSRKDILLGATAVATAASLSASGAASAAMDHQHMHTIPASRQNVINASLGCIKAAQEMLATCTAISQLASYDSRHLKEFSRTCIKVCEDCKDACDEHADKHRACKACSDSCADCIKACKDYIA